MWVKKEENETIMMYTHVDDSFVTTSNENTLALANCISPPIVRKCSEISASGSVLSQQRLLTFQARG